MAGINNLKEVYDKRGEDFLQNLLNNYVIINEKVNGTFFGVKKNKSNDSFSYFKKSGQISYVDRVLMKYYNAAITHFDNLSEEKRNRIPSNFYFGFEYLNNADDFVSVYDRLPKNQLVLSYIHRLDERGEPIETLQTSEDLNKWADYLEVERPPIIFEGVLDDEQKTAILDFVYADPSELYEKFKTTSFTKYIISVLNSNIEKSFLKNDLNSSIEGIVFRFYDENEEDPNSKTILAKLIDPIFQKKIKETNEKRENKSNDYIWLIVIDLMNYIESYDNSELKELANTESSESDSYDAKYVRLVNAIFKDFIKDFSYKYEGLQLDIPEYLKRPEFEVDESLIKDNSVLSLIKNNETYREIYRIFLNFFRRPRRKTSSAFFTKELLNQLNLQINKLKNIIMGDEIYESMFPTFNEFIGSDNDSSYLLNEEEFAKKGKAIPSKKVNILIGSFQPIGIGHIKAAKKLNSANGLPVILISIKGEKPTPKSPFSVKSTKVMLEKVQQENKDFIENVKVIPQGQIEDVLRVIRPEYEPILWGTTDSRLKDYALQLDYIKKRDIPLNISSEFKLIELPKYQQSEEIIDSIKSSDYATFKKQVPKSISSEFFNLQKELESFGLNESQVTNESTEVNNEEDSEESTITPEN